MEQSSFSIQLVGQNWQALPQKALFWMEQNALLISDLHLGRAAHLRKNGYALNESAHLLDIQNIQSLLSQQNYKTIYILGDLFHSHTLGNDSFLKELICESNANWILIKGNHDVFENEVYLELGFNEVFTELKFDHQILLKHEPSTQDLKRYFCISGHLHPGYRIRGKAKQAITLPCFYFGKQQIILPAIGMLTGLYRLKKRLKNEVFVVCHPKGVQSV